MQMVHFANKLSIFRASGRLIWPALYIIVLTACISLLKMHIKQSFISAAAVLILFVQFYDLSEKLSQINANFTAAYKYQDAFLQDTELWEKLGSDNSIKTIVLTDPIFETKKMYSLAAWAVKHKKNITSFDFARPIDRDIPQKIVSQYLNNPSPENLYIFLETSRYKASDCSLNLYSADGCTLGCKEQLKYISAEKKLSTP